MAHTLRAVLAILFMAGLLAPAPALADSGEQEVVEALTAWMEAYNSREAARITALYATDALFWGTRSPTIADRPGQIATYFEESVRNPNLRVRIEERRIRVYGDMGIAAGTYTVTDRKDGRDVATPGRFTFVFERREGRWMIVHHHSSRMPAP